MNGQFSLSATFPFKKVYFLFKYCMISSKRDNRKLIFHICYLFYFK